MFELAVILGIVIVLAIITIFAQGIRKVSQYEKGLVERWHAYEKTVEPGLRYVWPFVQRKFRVNMREQVIDVPTQEIITEDNVVVTIDAVVYYQIVDPRKATMKWKTLS